MFTMKRLERSRLNVTTTWTRTLPDLDEAGLNCSCWGRFVGWCFEGSCGGFVTDNVNVSVEGVLCCT